MKNLLTLCLLGFLCFFLSNQAISQCAFTEENGILVVETENIENITSPWEVRGDHVASGGKYIVYTAGNFYENPSPYELTIPFTITNPGKYVFKWFMRQPLEAEGDKSNDAWVDFIDATQYAGTTVVSGYHKFFGRSKVYFSMLGQLDIHGMTEQPWCYVDFDTAGTYTLMIAGRSEFLELDKLVLYADTMDFDEVEAMPLLETSNCENNYVDDCNGDLNGIAWIDSCGVCVDGNTGLLPCLPDTGKVFPIPGRIESENFGTGGEGVAYHDLDVGNNGDAYRPGEDVDIEYCGDDEGIYNVGWISPGEWLAYDVNVERDGKYYMIVRYAALSKTTSAIKLEFDDEVKIPELVFDKATGSWQGYADKLDSLELTTGEYTMKVSILDNGMNLNYITFVHEDDYVDPNGGPDALVGRAEEQFQLHPNPVSDQLTISWNDASFSQVQLISLSGKVVLTKKLKGLSGSTNISLDRVSPGYYLVALTGSKGVIHRKLMVN